MSGKTRDEDVCYWPFSDIVRMEGEPGGPARVFAKYTGKSGWGGSHSGVLEDLDRAVEKMVLGSGVPETVLTSEPDTAEIDGAQLAKTKEALEWVEDQPIEPGKDDRLINEMLAVGDLVCTSDGGYAEHVRSHERLPVVLNLPAKVPIGTVVNVHGNGFVTIVPGAGQTIQPQGVSGIAGGAYQPGVYTPTAATVKAAGSFEKHTRIEKILQLKKAGALTDEEASVAISSIRKR